jgi:hypothetical protein
MYLTAATVENRWHQRLAQRETSTWLRIIIVEMQTRSKQARRRLSCSFPMEPLVARHWSLVAGRRGCGRRRAGRNDARLEPHWIGESLVDVCHCSQRLRSKLWTLKLG